MLFRPPPNRVIRTPQLGQALGVVEIAPIKDQLPAQGSGQLIKIGRHKPFPLGADHQGIGTLSGLFFGASQ
jgi:hypothetical protein